VSAAFAALGRAFICVDGDFRVVHASDWLDRTFGAGTGIDDERDAAAEFLHHGGGRSRRNAPEAIGAGRGDGAS